MKKRGKRLTDVIKSKVDPRLKNDFKNCAEREGMTESQLLRKIAIQYLSDREEV